MAYTGKRDLRLRAAPTGSVMIVYEKGPALRGLFCHVHRLQKPAAAFIASRSAMALSAASLSTATAVASEASAIS